MKIISKILSVMLTMMMFCVPVQAKGKPYLSASHKVIAVNNGFTLKLKNGKKAKWSASNKKITLKRKEKTSVYVLGREKGTAYVYAKTGKKTLKCKITIKKYHSIQGSNVAAHYSKAGFDAINKVRKANGLTPLIHDPQLDAVAMTRAKEVTKNFDHYSASHALRNFEKAHSTDTTYYTIGENLGEMTWFSFSQEKSTAQFIVSLFTAEKAPNDGHKKQVLDPDCQYLTCAMIAKNGMSYWVFNFGTKTVENTAAATDIVNE